MHRAIVEILEYTGGIIGRRQYPALAGRLDDALRHGELIAVLPAVYVRPELRRDWRVLAEAVGWWDERAVIVGEAAAALTFWPEITPCVVEVANRRATLRRPGYRFSRRVLPAGQVVRVARIALAPPALTALDLAPRTQGDSIDRALRSRMTTLPAMHEALGATAHRHGNDHRRRLLLDSRGEPWSAAERRAHGQLRAAGITQWHANVPIVCDGQKFYQDIAMDDSPVVIEIDGKTHLRQDRFEHDRRRGVLLLLHGKQVLHYTWKVLTDDSPWFVSTVRRALERYAS